MKLSLVEGASVFVLTLALWTLYYVMVGTPPTQGEIALGAIGSWFAVLRIRRVVARGRQPGSIS